MMLNMQRVPEDDPPKPVEQSPFDLTRGWPSVPSHPPLEPKPEPLPWIGKRKAKR